MRLFVLLALALAFLALSGVFAADPPSPSATLTITDIQVVPAADSATIRWTTNHPAGGVVFYGPADGAWTESVPASGDGTSHTALLFDLAPATLYRFWISAYRADGTNAFSLPQTFTTAVATPTPTPALSAPLSLPLPASGPLVSDDFNRTSGLGPWTFVNPRGDATYELTGTDIRLIVPDGLPHEPWTEGNTAVRLVQAAPNADFDVIAKFNSRASGHIAIQGLIALADDANYVRFDISSSRTITGEESLSLFAARVNGSSQTTFLLERLKAPGHPVWLRMTRSGTTWQFRYSFDGTLWTSLSSGTANLSVTQVGVFAGNAKHNRYAQPFTASVDYFHVASAPLADDPQARPDGHAPLLACPPHTLSGTTLTVQGYSDEVTTGELRYGSRTAAGGTLTSGSGQTHVFTVGGLQTATSYWYRLTVTDGSGKVRVCSGVVRTLPAAVGSKPVIDVWGGTVQTFGARGNPQRWVNVLGQVIDPDGFATNTAFGTAEWPLRYRLNGGAERSLMLGPGSYSESSLNWRRVYTAGEFNIELDRAELQAGENRVEITAVDQLGNASVVTVTVHYITGQVWPLPYEIDWATVERVGDVAQAVDGLWVLEEESVRPAATGYDRLLAIGDVAWTDYEVQVAVTIQEIDTYRGERPNSGGPGVGLLLRWQGHWDATAGQETQPRWVYYPLGALGWYRLERYPDGNSNQREMHLHLDTGAATVFARDLSRMRLRMGTTYIFKMQVVTEAGGAQRYRLKVWQANEAEPTGWTVEGVAPTAAQPLGKGSLLLVAHHVDASFGSIRVRPLSGIGEPPATPSATPSATATPSAIVTPSVTPTATPSAMVTPSVTPTATLVPRVRLPLVVSP